MSDKPHRPRFQIHLSTAIVLMFAGGTLLWANMALLNLGHGDGTLSSRGEFGFPISFIIKRNSGLELDIALLILNVFVNFLMLFGLVAIFEHIARRREARKP